MSAEMYKRKLHDSIKLIYDSAVSAVNGQNLIRNNVRLDSNKLVVRDQTFTITKDVYLIGFGKAVLGMAEEIETMFRPRQIKGILSVPFGSVNILKPKFAENSGLEIRECATNNLPDDASCQNAQLIRNFVSQCTKDDLVLVLISGGGSACLSLPKSPLILDEKLRTIKLLVQSGANIKELNKVRKKLSEVKGGQLAEEAHPAILVSLIISDIVGDPLQDIASGPTVQNEDRWSDAKDIVVRYELENKVPNNVMTILNQATPHQVQKYFQNVHNYIIGNNRAALESAKSKAESLGYQTVILTNAIEGVGDEVCQTYIDLVNCIICARKNQTKEPVNENNKNSTQQDQQQTESKLNVILSDWPQNNNAVQDIVNIVHKKDQLKLCIVCGGEITWNMNNVASLGKGGRNLHLTLLFQYEIGNMFGQMSNSDSESKFHVTFSSAGTDGIDGSTDVAGSIAGNYYNQDDQNRIKHHLDRFDSFHYYEDKMELVIKPGHTGTNVMDMHVLIIEE
uniref:Glycerate kinase n=1 Tax=Cacopsylla melanoneura TaxID=428564 RepID=A0A8D8WTZ3_9HEMI